MLAGSGWGLLAWVGLPGSRVRLKLQLRGLSVDSLNSEP